MLRPIALFCVILAVAALQQEVHAGDAYLVKQRKIENVPEALSILRHFIPTRENFDDKCQRYAVLLKQMAIEPTNQFAIAELGLIKASSINNQFKDIDVETLRQLYMDAINKSLASHIDLSMLELVDCLIRKFRSHDAKARAFLNNPELRETVDQFKNIMSLPVAFSQEPNARHPSLTVEQLQPAIRRLMLDLYNGDERRLLGHFPSARTTQARQPEGPSAQAAAVASSNNQAPPEAENLPTPSNEPIGLSEEEEAYLERVNEALKDVYSSLPIQTSLPRRCEAYARIVDSNPENVGNQLVQNIVQETAERNSQSGPAKFVPPKDTRESFLIALNSFKPEQRDSVWLDIISCVSEWENEDSDVKSYLSNPELMKVIDEMLKALEANSPQQDQEQEQQQQQQQPEQEQQ